MKVLMPTQKWKGKIWKWKCSFFDDIDTIPIIVVHLKYFWAAVKAIFFDTFMLASLFSFIVMGL